MKILKFKNQQLNIANLLSAKIIVLPIKKKIKINISFNTNTSAINYKKYIQSSLRVTVIVSVYLSLSSSVLNDSKISLPVVLTHSDICPF